MPTLKQTSNWGQVQRDMQEAKRRAGLGTVADCAAQAQQPGYAPRDTSNMANHITFGQDDENTFYFGNTVDPYTLVQEITTTFNHPNGGPFFLRRSADKHMPSFGARLAEELKS